MALINRAMLLLSYGIDSPVAGYLLSEQGVELVGLHFAIDDNEKNISVILELARKIGIYKLIIIPYSQVLSKFEEICKSRFMCVLCKRMMYRIGCRLADNEKCNFLASGENLGQVASQTLANMIVLQDVLDKIILQPLLCMDKNEIIDIAKKIGTFELSNSIKKDCLFVPVNPATKAKHEDIEKEEDKIDMEIITEAIKLANIVYV